MSRVGKSLRIPIRTMEEYKLSKCLLMGVVNCKIIAKCFTKDTIKDINSFLHGKVFVHEGHYLALDTKKLFNMEQHSNSAHEGTNNGVKNCGDGLHVRDLLVSATEKCCSYDKNRFVQRHFDVAKQHHNFNSYSGNFQFITKHVVGVLHNEKKQSEEYIADVDLSDGQIDFYVMKKDPFWEMDKRIDDEIEMYLEEEESSSTSVEKQEPLYMTKKGSRKLPSRKLFEKMPEDEKK